MATVMPWPLPLRVLDADVQLHRLALAGLGAVELRRQLHRAVVGAGRLPRLIRPGQRVREDVLAGDLDAHRVLARLQRRLGVGHLQGQRLRRAGGERQRGDLLLADEQPQLARFRRLLVGLGVQDQRLQRQDGRLRRAEAAVAAALLADPVDRLLDAALNSPGLAFSQPSTARAVVSICKSRPPEPVMLVCSASRWPSAFCSSAALWSRTAASAVFARLMRLLATRARK